MKQGVLYPPEKFADLGKGDTTHFQKLSVFINVATNELSKLEFGGQYHSWYTRLHIPCIIQNSWQPHCGPNHSVIIIVLIIAQSTVRDMKTSLIILNVLMRAPSAILNYFFGAVIRTFMVLYLFNQTPRLLFISSPEFVRHLFNTPELGYSGPFADVG